MWPCVNQPISKDIKECPGRDVAKGLAKHHFLVEFLALVRPGECVRWEPAHVVPRIMCVHAKINFLLSCPWVYS